MYFPDAGEKHTDETLNIAKETALTRGIKDVVVASTRGKTALKAAEIFRGAGVNLVVVTHNTGFNEPGKQEFDPEIRQKLAEEGVKVLTGTMVLRNLDTAIRKKFSYSETEIVNATLRMFCQGAKVCVEMAAMASDAGLVPPGDVIAIAGTSYGADTAMIIASRPSNQFFDIKVREILIKPREF